MQPKPNEADAPHNCPHCGVSLLGEPIPEKDLQHYSGRYFKREIGVEDPDKYDGVYYYYCPDCKGEWGGYRALERVGRSMKTWQDYTDERGLVTQKQSMGGDGGDSLQRTCSAAILENLEAGGGVWGCQFLAQVVSHLASPDYSKYRRSWHPTKWYSEFNRTSRDQLTPLVIALGLFGMQSLLFEVLIDHLKRGLLFAYNTRRNFQYETAEIHAARSTPDVPWDYSWKVPDVTGPEFWALYVRGFRYRVSYPVLLVLDLHTLIGSIVLRFQKDEDDVINHALVLEYAKVRMDTPWMWLARKITPRSWLQERMDKFFGKEIEPPLNEMFRSLK